MSYTKIRPKKRTRNLVVHVIRIFVAHQTSFVVKAAQALCLVRSMRKKAQKGDKFCILTSEPNVLLTGEKHEKKTQTILHP